MISLKSVTNPDDLSIARNIYLSSFPPEERRDWDLIVNEDNPELSGIYEENALVGLVTLWHFEDFIYVEHFAVDSSMRSKGTGAAVLSLLAGEPLPLLLEIEPPHSSPDAERRLKFYSRNGFTTISTTYIQPPYKPGLPEVPLHLMSTSAELDPEKAAETLHRHVYKAI